VDSVLVVGFPAGAFQANCYLLATGPGAECVIVDPGQEATGKIGDAVREHNLVPVGMLATHGHIDHVGSAAEVAKEHGIGLRLHPADEDLLEDRLRLDPLEEGVVELAGLSITVVHSPGHTPGSVLFRLETAEGGRLVITGDTLFAGSVGRTDRPGGSTEDLTHSLLTKVLTLPGEAVVLPGHGPSTTIDRERSANPFLTGVHS
jgi:glyoxylase-like metal-dependent hydrolase (beta-lactamase superfamily II)